MSVHDVTTALADRYSVAREIGSGGMAIVYEALDLRHERRVAIKVLRPALAEALGTDRFLREIRIAASLSHPNIVPLYDSGEAAGLLYYVMPLIEGESLRARLARGPLPVDEALRIAEQVGSALAYAHGRGIVHRDIKPDNVLLSSGQAVVTDFGVARAVEAAGGSGLTATGIAVGTPAYMSPEQVAGGEVDARADQYSLGCTLFEMLAGEPPFPGPSARDILAGQLSADPPDLRAAGPSVPARVAVAVTRALAKEPADRYPSIEALCSDLRRAEAAPVPGRSHRALKLVLAAGTVAAITATVLVLSASQPVPFEQRDAILISDFDNRTGDTLFDRSLDRAFAVGLQQSRYVNVVPRSRAAQTLRYMGRDPTSALDEALAREVALRQGVQVVVAPSISRLGERYSVTTNAIDAATGAILVSRSEEADGTEAVLGALDDLAKQLRKDLGEPVFARLRNGVRLDQATTPSLEALQAWTAGNEQWGAGNLDAAASLYRRAVELDSSFAMAHVDLGQYYYWRHNDRVRGDAHFERALALTDRVTDRERAIIEAKAAGWQGNSGRAIEAYTIHLAAYPDDNISWNNLGYEYLRAGLWDDAASAYGRALALDSLDDNAWVNLATVHNAASREEEAIEAYQHAFALNAAYRTNPNINHEYGFNLVALGRFDEAEEVFGWMLDGSREMQSRGNRSMALLRMRRGRYADAITHLRRSVLLDEFDGPGTTALRDRAYLASALLTSRGPDAAREALLPVLEIVDSVYIEPGFLAIAGRLFAEVGAIEAARTLLDTLAARANDENDYDQGALHFLRGHIHLAGQRADSAAAEFERATIYTNQQNPLYLGSLVRAQILLGRTADARRSLETLLASSSDGREGQEAWILAHYQMAQIADQTGDAAKALDWYRRFLLLWDQADDGLVPVPSAQRRLAELNTGDMR